MTTSSVTTTMPRGSTASAETTLITCVVSTNSITCPVMDMIKAGTLYAYILSLCM